MCGFQCRYGLLARDAREIVEELVETVIPFEVTIRFRNGTRVPTKTGVPPRISGSLWTTDFCLAIAIFLYQRAPRELRRAYPNPPATRVSRRSYHAASWKMMPSVKRSPERSRLTPCRIVTR